MFSGDEFTRGKGLVAYAAGRSVTSRTGNHDGPVTHVLRVAIGSIRRSLGSDEGMLATSAT